MEGLLFIGLSMYLLMFGLGIASVVFWIWMLIDCAKYEPSAGNDKLIWILVIIFLHVLGALLYYFIRRPERIATVGA